MKISINKNIFFTLFIIFLANFFVFYNSLFNEFIWDDLILIQRNKNLENFRNFFKVFNKDFFYNEEKEFKEKTGYYRPIITLSYFIDYQFWRKNPFGYHLTNLFFHILNSFLIFFIIKFLSNNFFLSFLSAFIFSIHPSHVESVSWISGRTDVISAFFLFLSFYSYIIFCKKNNVLIFISSILFFSLAVLSKEITLVFPFILIFYNYFFISSKLNIFLKKLFFIFPYFVVLAIYYFIRVNIFKIFITSPHNNNIFICILTFLIKGLPFYLKTFIFPLQQNHYKIIHLVEFNFFNFIIFLLILFLFIFFIKIIKNTLLLFFVFFILIFFIPLTNIIQINMPEEQIFPVAERFIYIHSFPFFFIFSFVIFYLYKKIKYKKIIIIFILFIILFYSIKTISQNRVWKDNETLLLYNLKNEPFSTVINENLGTLYFEKKDYIKAKKYYEKVIHFNPPSQIAFTNLLVIYNKTNEIDSGIIIGESGKKLFPFNYDLINNLGILYLYKNDTVNAISNFEQAIRINPKNFKAYYNAAFLFLNNSDFQNAFYYANKAYELNSNDSDILYILSYLYFYYKKDFFYSKYFLKRLFDITEKNYKAYKILLDIFIIENNFSEINLLVSKYLKNFPYDFDIYNYIALSLSHNNQFLEAIKYWLIYANFNSNDWKVYYNIATAYYKLNDYKNALIYLLKAKEFNPDNKIFDVKINELKKLLNQR